MNKFIPEKLKQKYINFIHFDLPDFNISRNRISNMIRQSGGGKHENNEYSYTINNQKFTVILNTTRHGDYTEIVVTDQNNTVDCVTVHIYTDTTIAILNNMTIDRKCAIECLPNDKGGHLLFKFILHYLKKNKDNLYINRIILKDNSFLYCNNRIHNLKLARLRMITHNGQTWYMKYGFLPYDANKQIPDIKYIKGIEKNKEILQKLKTSFVDIVNITKKLNLKLLPEIERLLAKYILFDDFIKKLMENKNKYCCLIEHILDDVYENINLSKRLLIDYHSRVFYLDI